MVHVTVIYPCTPECSRESFVSRRRVEILNRANRTDFKVRFSGPDFLQLESLHPCQPCSNPPPDTDRCPSRFDG